MSTRTIKQPKIQETSSSSLIKCVFELESNLNLTNCSSNYKNEAVQTLSRRLGTPLYIPLISIITSFLLIYKKEKSYNFLKKYMLFVITFIILILAEIFLKYTGLSSTNCCLLFYFTVGSICFFLHLLIKKIKY